MEDDHLRVSLKRTKGGNYEVRQHVTVHVGPMIQKERCYSIGTIMPGTLDFIGRGGRYSVRLRTREDWPELLRELRRAVRIKDVLQS